jgi:hypothetical protein
VSAAVTAGLSKRYLPERGNGHCMSLG